MEWSVETYRLDEIEGKFGFPCVVRVNEGFYSLKDVEGFSQGDILSIDSKMVLEKVAAHFKSYDDVCQEITNKFDESSIEFENEILVPLNYKGKLKIIQNSKIYENVRELATDFPRYVTLSQDLNVKTSENQRVTINSGTKLELERNIPRSTSGPTITTNNIVIHFQHSNRVLTAELPLNTCGSFKTETDNNEYTIREALERYNFPLHVRFVDDKIKRVYTQDLLEGIENMNVITESLLLNRFVKQTVLIGHYKPLDVSNDSERFRPRTLVVLPMDNPHICETEVNVSEAVNDRLYQRTFLVRNVSNTNTGNILDGSLYVDFAMTSRIKLIAEEVSGDDSNIDKPPPRPPKPANIKPKIAPKPQTGWKKKALSLDSKTLDQFKDNNKRNDEDDDGDYIIPAAMSVPKPETGWQKRKKSLSLDSKYPYDFKDDRRNDEKNNDVNYILPKTRSVSETVDNSEFSLANIDFARNDTEKEMSLGRKIRKKVATNISSIKSSFRNLKVSRERQLDVFEAKVEKSESFKAESDDSLYDDINEKDMLDFNSPQSPTSSSAESKKYNDTSLKAVKYHEKANKPMALVQPVKGKLIQQTKPFKDLNNEELVERLRLCGLVQISQFCKKERLDGSFFNNLSKETLEKDMNLKGIELAKFIQMRDANWVPTLKL